MKYVTALLEDTTFLNTIEEIEKLEATRIYCHHGFAHLMDVARLASMNNAMKGNVCEEEQVYLAALLHDIGRAQEYKNEISHAIAGKRLAGEILLRMGYPMEKMQLILAAIEGHQEAGQAYEKLELARFIYEADKKSRACFLCKAKDSCKWGEDKKNKPKDWR